jgi:hypothetical protein
MADNSFKWPAGFRAAVSLTFDDARPSQVSEGMPILDRYGVPATFFVSFANLEKQVEEWQHAITRGHEIGNHTVSHPCSGNFLWSRSQALEDYNLERMEQELVSANERIQNLLHVTPRTFAYPCGQTFVGRGEDARSYVPVTAKHFLAARGFHAETINDPAYCDLAQVLGIDADSGANEGGSHAKMQTWIDRALESGGWAVFVAHDVGTGGGQILNRDALEAVCRRASDKSNGIWIDTMGAIADYVKQNREL